MLAIKTHIGTLMLKLRGQVCKITILADYDDVPDIIPVVQ